jgi:hypothetical protein
VVVAIGLVVVLVMAHRNKRKFQLRSRAVSIGPARPRRKKRSKQDEMAAAQEWSETRQESRFTIIGHMTPKSGTSGASDQWCEMKEPTGAKSRNTGGQMNWLYQAEQPTVTSTPPKGMGKPT